VKLRELLDLDVMREADVRVLAGKENLDRPVRWVHTGEIADIAQYLSGGEVLLTAGTGLSGAATRQLRGYIRELAEAGAAAVIIELGLTFEAVPPGMVKEAEACGFVLIEMPKIVPFVAVTQAAHTRLISAAHETLTRALEIDDALNRLILEGALLPALLELLAERLGNPVVLEDAARHVVAFGRGNGSVAPVLREWARHSRQGHATQEQTLTVRNADSDPPCAWCPVALRGEVRGRLHLVECQSPIDDVARLALGRAAASIALHLMSERDIELSQAAESSLLHDLTRTDSFNAQQFQDRAHGLGVELGDELAVIVLGPTSREVDRDSNALKLDTDAVRDAFRLAQWHGLMSVVEGDVVAVVPAQAPDFDALLDTMVGALDRASGSRLHVGVSRPTRASLLPQAYTDALTALRLGPAVNDGSLHRYESLVLHRLLSPLLPGPELASFVEQELGPLVAYDEEHNAELVRTLDAYLQANGSKSAAAHRLHLQRRSVYYRLTRIEELLGHSIDDPARRVQLYVALRGRELLDVGESLRIRP
jgi:purine catabolism regulator